MYLFVYGTLLSSSNVQVAVDLRKKSKILGEAYTLGRLYDLGSYPGYIPTQNKKEKVFGQLLEIQDLSILIDLDEYEGVPELYRREEVECVSQNGIVMAHIYIYQGLLEEAWQIHNGKYQN